MAISREATIRKFMRVGLMPRAVAEEAVDGIDAYVADWAKQMRAYLDRTGHPVIAKRKPKRKPKR